MAELLVLKMVEATMNHGDKKAALEPENQANGLILLWSPGSADALASGQ